VIAILLLQQLPYWLSAETEARDGNVIVNFNPGHPVNRFIPSARLGAGVDGHAEGETQRASFPPQYRGDCISAGLKPLTYV